MNKKFKIMISIIVPVILILLTVLISFIINKSKVYTVTFDTDGGTIIEPINVKNGKTIKTPTEPEKEGYEFVMWSLNGKEYDFNKPVKSNLSLKAEWKLINEEANTYRVVFDTDGGTLIESQLVEEGAKVLQPSNPEKVGYTFIGWQLDGSDYNFDSTVTKDITLKAIYEKNVTNKTNNGITNNVINNSNVSDKTTTAKSSNTNSSNSSNNVNGASSNNTGSSTAPAAAKKYTVSFNSNGGTNVSSQTVAEGSKATQPSNPIKEGYTFAGWTLNGNVFNFSNAINSNITLVAKWTQKTYVVRVTAIDAYSPDRVLSVYENGTKIAVSAIKYTDGYTLCSGSNTTVNKNDIEGETSLIVVLSGGTQVSASIS